MPGKVQDGYWEQFVPLWSGDAVAQLPGEGVGSPSVDVFHTRGDMALRDVGSGWDGIELGDPLGLFQPQ